ncbi:unnamed protein product [Bemisia tabaci]|uniref:CHK kinase-like domain-containing protein n=3 Tax=Bemisia tabaci TaxID=7038 RepID=A0A9N9ZYR8_BEMTA|nr:unnamed protein product [Bemisia tabaci]
MSSANRLLSEVLPRVVEAGNFGPENVRFVEFIEDRNDAAQDGFCASNILFGNVIMENRNKDRTSQSVVIKVRGVAVSSFNWSSALQFYNELFFYSKIVPFLRRFDDGHILDEYFPKFFYGVATLQEDESSDIIILENLQRNGFKLAPSRTFLDYEYIKLSLRGLARFHSLSLIAKAKDPVGWKKILSEIRETKWAGKTFELESSCGYLRKNCMRGILPLLEDHEYANKLRNICDLIENPTESMVKIVSPIEPLAVLCHGDFCRNNMFFQHNTEGVPIDVKFFDLGTIRHSSPAIDLSFYLFMHTSPEMRPSKWDELIALYTDALESELRLKNIEPPSKVDIEQEFQRRGFYGYVLSSFFLPMMMDDNIKKSGADNNLTLEQQVENRIRTGGERATQFVSAIVKHMIDKGFDFKYISNFTSEADDPERK